MLYALTTTIAAGLLLLLLLAVATILVRRALGADWPSIGRWRWYPSPLGLLLLIPIAGLVLWRFLPALLFIPFILPLFRRGRRMAMPFFFMRNMGRRNRPPGEGRNGDDDAIEGKFRRLDDE